MPSLIVQIRKFAITIAIWPLLITGEPFLAAQSGYKCSQCHVNRTGGGKRTEFGNIYMQNLLPSRTLPQPFFDPKISSAISTGANFRFEGFTDFSAERKETITQRVPFFSSRDTTYKASSDSRFIIPEGNIYMDITLLQNFLKIYIDQGIAPSPQSREAFVMVETPARNAYAKAGKMLQPFGLRLYDDLTSTRRISQFTYANPKTGVEIGLEPGPIAGALSITQTQSSFLTYGIIPGIKSLKPSRIGGSIYRTYPSIVSPLESLESEELGLAVFATAGIWKFTAMAEVDAIQKIESGKNVWKDLGFVELNYLMAKGWNLKIEYDWLNPDNQNTFARNGESRLVFGIEWFPAQFLELAAYYHFRQSRPDDIIGNQDQLRFMLHSFY